MHWLRLRPETAEELDRVDSKGRWIDSFEFDEESDHEDHGRHASSLFEGADDEEDDEEEEEEEEEPPAPPPAPSGPGRSGGRHKQRSTPPIREATECASDADSDCETVILRRRSPPRHSKSYRARRTTLPRRMLDPSLRPAVETDTDSGVVSSSSCSSSALDTPREDAPLYRPARPAVSRNIDTDLAPTTSFKGLNVEGVDEVVIANSAVPSSFTVAWMV